ERPGLGRRPSSDRAHAGGKRCQQRQPRPSVFRHHGSVGGGEGACLAATASWAACSRRITNAELRRPKTAALLGPAPRRSALRANRRVACAERERREFKEVNFKSFFSELKRRNVYKVAVTYIVAGWALSQGIAQVFPVFDVPNWAIRLVVLLVMIGLPIALVLAWAFEITPQGIKRTETADAMPQAGLQKNNAWIYVVVVGAVVSIGLFFLGRYTAGNAASRNSQAAAALPQKSIAVLPLLNESGDPKDEYFSDGLSEELIAALAQISGLKVIGRSSSFRFTDRKDEPKTIGERLGVSTLLDGTVRKQGDRVRIVAELVNAADGIQLWTRTFDRHLKDIFAVQEEIARAVAESLKVTLLGSQDRPAQRGAPSNVEAHNAYLQGHFHFQRRNLEDYRKAVGYFDQAIQLDPDYALACAERSEAWTFIGDLTGQREPAWSK